MKNYFLILLSIGYLYIPSIRASDVDEWFGTNKDINLKEHFKTSIEDSDETYASELIHEAKKLDSALLASLVRFNTVGYESFDSFVEKLPLTKQWLRTWTREANYNFPLFYGASSAVTSGTYVTGSVRASMGKNNVFINKLGPYPFVGTILVILADQIFSHGSSATGTQHSSDRSFGYFSQKQLNKISKSELDKAAKEFAQRMEFIFGAKSAVYGGSFENKFKEAINDATEAGDMRIFYGILLENIESSVAYNSNIAAITEYMSKISSSEQLFSIDGIKEAAHAEKAAEDEKAAKGKKTYTLAEAKAIFSDRVRVFNEVKEYLTKEVVPAIHDPSKSELSDFLKAQDLEIRKKTKKFELKYGSDTEQGK